MALAADPAGDSAGALTGDSATKVVFNRDVRPILSDLCFQCHGPDEKKREGGLRLDLRDAAIATTAIVPGNLADSELVARIVSTDPELRMPPPETNKSLSEAQIDTLRRWIEQGAEYQTHWAFIPPTKPTPPETDDRSWPINPIDRFVLASRRFGTIPRGEPRNVDPPIVARPHRLATDDRGGRDFRFGSLPRCL
jgi:mono/diheme cytochrome c family protein